MPDIYSSFNSNLLFAAEGIYLKSYTANISPDHLENTATSVCFNNTGE